MCWKFCAWILVTLLVIDLTTSKQASDLSKRRQVLPPGTSEDLSVPNNNQQPDGEVFPTDRRPHVNPPAMNSNNPDVNVPVENNNEVEGESSRNTNRNRPRPNVSVRNSVAMPGNSFGNAQQQPMQNTDPNQPAFNAPMNNNPPMSGNNVGGVQQPMQNTDPNQPAFNAPMNNNGAMPGNNFGGVQQPIQNTDPNQPAFNAPMNNNPPMSGNNVGGVQQPMQNPNPNLAGNVGVGQGGMGRNLPVTSPPVAGNSNQPVGPAAFGGSSWPDFFRRPNVPANSESSGNSPMQNPQANGGQIGQGQAGVSDLLNKLGNLGGMFGANNQGGVGGR